MRVRNFLILLACFALAPVGCKTAGRTGVLAGSGIGALAGQLIGHSTEATLIGAAVGTGVGYIIGNEVDKKKAADLTSQTTPAAPTHSEIGKFGGTRWSLISLNPRNIAPPYVSKVIEFKTNGRVMTTTTNPDGRVEFFDESYRVVGDTLIINKPGYLVNARYQFSNSQLILSAEKFSAVLERIG